MRVRYSIHHAREPLVVQRGTTASYTYHYYFSIDKLRHQSLYTSSCRQTELKTMLSSRFLRCQNEIKTTVKENILQNFCFQELQAGTEIDHACSSWKLLPFSVFFGGSHFALLQFYSHTLYCHYRNIGVESNDGSHLESLDAFGPGRRIFKKCALAR